VAGEGGGVVEHIGLGLTGAGGTAAGVKVWMQFIEEHIHSGNLGDD
jgi:hypothetical protein